MKELNPLAFCGERISGNRLQLLERSSVSADLYTLSLAEAKERDFTPVFGTSEAIGFACPGADPWGFARRDLRFWECGFATMFKLLASLAPHQASASPAEGS